MFIIVAGVRAVAKPAIVQQEEFRTRLAGTVIEIAVRSLPVVQQHGAVFLRIANGIRHGPTVETAAGFALALPAISVENGRCGERSSTFQVVLRTQRIHAGEQAQVLVPVHIESKLETAAPT